MVLADGPSTDRGELALGKKSWSLSCLGEGTTTRIRFSIYERL
jgi:hypothetical protein